MGQAATAYIGLGSNLDDPLTQVRTALRELDQIRDCRLLKHSNLYRSAPMGPPGQPDYINAVAAVETRLAADALLSELQAIEARHQRQRRERWGPRTLDLDLLLFGNEVIDNARLSVPHPGLDARSFVLIPLYEIAPDLILPDNRVLAELVRHCSREGLRQLQAGG